MQVYLVRMRRLIVVVILMILLNGCRPFGQIRPFTDSPCDLPCWYGLTPGVTEVETSKAITASIPVIDSANVHNADAYMSSEIFRMYRILRDGAELYVDSSAGKVKVISIGEHEIPYGETLKDIVNRFGAPEYVFASYQGPENVKLVIDFGYPSKGAIFWGYTLPSNRSYQGEDQFGPETPVVGAMYVEPGPIDQVLNLPELGTRLAPCVLKYKQPWTGFGSIKIPGKECAFQ